MPINTITSAGVYNFEPIYTGQFDPMMMPLGQTSTTDGQGRIYSFGWRTKTKGDRRREKGTKK